MSKQNNALLINILKNSGPDFKFKDELIRLHSKSLQLESSINLRRQIEYQYNKLKLEEVKERIDEIKFQKKFFIKRNNDILDDIQKRKIKNLENAANAKEIYNCIEKYKKRYGDYIDSLKPKIQNEFNVQLHKESNKLAIERVKELKMLEKLQYKNNYYEEITKENEKLANEIKNLKRKNVEEIEKYKQRENNYLESQKNLQNQINNFKVDKEKDNFDINEYYNPNSNADNKKINVLKEFSELNNLKLKKDSLNSEISLQDLRKQIINPQNGIPDGTLNQNFDMPKSNDIINNNNINNDLNDIKKIEENITPGQDINNNNKLGINNNIQYEGSNFNLFNSKIKNDNNINNINPNNDNNINLNNNNIIPNKNINNINPNNDNNKINSDNNNDISQDVNFVNINNLSNNKRNLNSIKQNENQSGSENEYEGFEEEEV